MAFLLQNLIPVSAGQQIDANRLWWYTSADDTAAQIKASGYFNTATQFLNQNDVLFIVGADDKQMLEVTSASQAATVTTIEYTGTAATVTMAEGSILVGNASGVGAPVDASTDAQLLLGNGTTLASVAMSNDATIANTGAVTIANDAVTTAKIADANVTQAKIATNSLDATVVGNIVDAGATAGIPVTYSINTNGGATADTDVTVTHKFKVTDVWVINRGAGTTSDTITVKNGANAITDAIDISSGDKTVARAGEVDDAQWIISAAGTLRVTETDGGGNDSPPVTVMVYGYRSP